MTITIGINGFGRIGRNVLRALIENGREDVRVVAINDLAEPETNAHLLEFDSVHGRLGRRVTVNGDTMDAGTGPIRITAERNPADLPWSDVDIVMECTGVFRSVDAVQPHLENGSKAVLISAPASGSPKPKTIVYGVNQGDLTADDRVVSNASCTTNCLAPVAKVLNDSFGIKRGMMTTVHAYTGDQPTHDRAHKDLNRARAAAASMIPTSTGAAEAVGLVLPELKGRLTGQAIRVPTLNVSCVDMVTELERDVTVEEVNAALIAASEGALANILGVEDRPTVSIDYNHDPRSSIVSLDQTKILEGNMLRTLSWYDNEWGFSNRMIDTAIQMGKLIKA
ncbi:type I glyceraldehyde-3-phosphate dehydrogenase [Aliishimia ponticola]|uniref:Glyceraldehyde-3-phosphate dehydrogenase n=1 Tax=Aliishimia ponticola TaxID=2499833 RepID=A0A4V6S237_9RHOB|nr:type I glyceraldehyde-3-phosphate dehydrogenase [Aliishimia ponticola]THH38353.1 type I glyceraldehyde-3-phosphate dehydrogenase [Aliishimia ponticola]